MKKTVLIVIFSYLFIIFFAQKVIGNHQYVDSETLAVCKEEGAKMHIQYAQTEWKDFNFEQSCIDNIKYTSPLFMNK